MLLRYGPTQGEPKTPEEPPEEPLDPYDFNAGETVLRHKDARACDIFTTDACFFQNLHVCVYVCVCVFPHVHAVMCI